MWELIKVTFFQWPGVLLSILVVIFLLLAVLKKVYNSFGKYDISNAISSAFYVVPVLMILILLFYIMSLLLKFVEPLN